MRKCVSGAPPACELGDFEPNLKPMMCQNLIHLSSIAFLSFGSPQTVNRNMQPGGTGHTASGPYAV